MWIVDGVGHNNERQACLSFNFCIWGLSDDWCVRIVDSRNSKIVSGKNEVCDFIKYI